MKLSTVTILSCLVALIAFKFVEPLIEKVGIFGYESEDWEA